MKKSKDLSVELSKVRAHLISALGILSGLQGHGKYLFGLTHYKALVKIILLLEDLTDKVGKFIKEDPKVEHTAVMTDADIDKHLMGAFKQNRTLVNLWWHTPNKQLVNSAFTPLDYKKNRPLEFYKWMNKCFLENNC